LKGVDGGVDQDCTIEPADTVVQLLSKQVTEKTIDEVDMSKVEEEEGGKNEAEDQKLVIELLRQQVATLEREAMVRETTSREEKEAAEKRYKTLCEESNKKIGELKKAFEAANRDKESMVIKYAMGEKDIMIAKRGKEEVEKRLKESLKDKEGLQYKVKTLGTERTRLMGVCESRAQDFLMARKEGDKLKEEAKTQEARVKALEVKVKAEVDAHEQTRESLNTTFKQLCELQGSIDEMKAEAETMIAAAKVEGEEIKRKGAEQEAEQSVKLMIDSVAAAELDTVRKRQKEVVQENNELSQKVQSLQQELATTNRTLASTKEAEAKLRAELVDLYAKCAELESAVLQVEREKEKAAALEVEVTRLREEGAEVQADMVACRRKEAELLEFTRKLTDKNVSLQSEFSSIEVRAKQVEEREVQMSASLSRSEAALLEVTSRLEEEASKRREETELLARKLAEKTRAGEVDRQAVIDVRAEMEVVKRQNQARLKELTKELAATKKKLDNQAETLSIGVEETSLGSRCSSSSSLHRGEDVSPSNVGRPEISKEVVRDSREGMDREIKKVKEGAETQQMLVEKIVGLQRACARRQEKLDFLEEHVEQLLAEIKKKNRVIQHYLMSLEPGALISEESDIHKAVVGSAGVGVMASLYGSKVTEGGMTLELSLEINKKLQAVLEDTLLKNITLKDNLSTLGEEVSKMAMERHKEKNIKESFKDRHKENGK